MGSDRSTLYPWQRPLNSLTIVLYKIPFLGIFELILITILPKVLWWKELIEVYLFKEAFGQIVLV